MALTRVQATPPVLTQTATASLVFASPPAVGHAIVVLVTNQFRAFAPTACTDNYGNPYTQVLAKQTGLSSAAIYYCGSIGTTGASFTVSVNLADTIDSLTGIAIEFDTALTVDQSVNNGGSFTGTAYSTGATAALTTAADTVVTALLCTSSTQSAITVGTVSPAWLQEYEVLSGGPSEGDSRIIPAAGGTTQSASWTVVTPGDWSALLVAFKGAVVVSTTPVNLSQLPIEVLRASPLSALRLSQLPIEILHGAVVVSTTPARLSQLPLEVLRAALVVSTTPARLSQLPIEVLHQLPPPLLAVTQLVAETLDRIPNSPAAVTQLVAEFLNQGLVHEARVTQLLCELIVIPRALEACPPASAFPIDPATDTSGCAPALPIDPD